MRPHLRLRIAVLAREIAALVLLAISLAISLAILARAEDKTKVARRRTKPTLSCHR
jgi:hypothetical protein